MLNNFVHEITHRQSDIIKSFAVFLLLLVTGYVSDDIFTCFQITYIQNNKWLQYIFLFLLFYFLVTVISETGKLKFTPPIEKMLYSLFYFIGFLVVMRLDIKITALVLLLIFIIYFLEINKDFYLERGTNISDPLDKDIYNDNQYWITFNWPYKIRLFKVKKEDFKLINQIETLIYYLILFLLVVGFIAYGGEIHDTLKTVKNLTWINVITNTKICRLQNRKSFLHYLRIGLGLRN